jgi:hypothetical protein
MNTVIYFRDRDSKPLALVKRGEWQLYAPNPGSWNWKRVSREPVVTKVTA